MTETKSWSLDLIVKENDALAVFSGDHTDQIIGDIEREARSVVSDVDTRIGRIDIASLAHKISRSKVALDTLGKNLVSGWKSKAKAVDAERKIIRDRLDLLRDEVRLPLVEWEKIEAELVKQVALAAALLVAHEAGLAEHSLWLREKAISDRENAILAAEKAEQDEKAREAKKEAQRIHDETIAKNAAAAAKRDAAEAVERADNKRKAEVLAAKEREAKLVSDKKEALRKAEVKRKADIKEAQAEVERKIRADQEKRAAAAEKVRLQEEKKAANKKHRARIDVEVLKQFVDCGIEAHAAEILIGRLADNNIKHVSINY